MFLNKITKHLYPQLYAVDAEFKDLVFGLAKVHLDNVHPPIVMFTALFPTTPSWVYEELGVY